MVLADEKGDRIYSTVKKQLMMKYEPLLAQGKAVTISTFGVAEYNGQFKYVDHRYKINFSGKTEVQEYTGPYSGTINGLKFVRFHDILSGSAGIKHSADVVGHVVSSSGLVMSQTEGKISKRICFEMADVEGTMINCALWGGLAQEVADFIGEATSTLHIIVAFQLGRVRTFQGKPVMSCNYFGTRVLINSTAPEVVEFTRAIRGSAAPHCIPLLASGRGYSVGGSFLSGCRKMSIDQLRGVAKAGRYIVVGTITRIQKDQPWRYLACRKCKKGVELAGTFKGSDLWRCAQCQKQGVAVIDRYKVQVRVVDDTGSVTFVIFDQDVRMVVKRSAPEVVAAMPSDSELEFFPDELDELVGKKFAFKVVVDHHHLNGASSVYTVGRMTADAEVMSTLLDSRVDDVDPAISAVAPPTPAGRNAKRPIGSTSAGVGETSSKVPAFSMKGEK